MTYFKEFFFQDGSTGGGGAVQDPTYTIPTSQLTVDHTGDKEVGTIITQNMQADGVKNDAGAFSQIEFKRDATVLDTVSTPAGTPTTDVPPQFGFANPNSPNESYSESYVDSNYAVVAGSTTWSSVVSYAAGLPKDRSNGDLDARASSIRSVNAPQAADPSFTKSEVVNGIYPYFYFTSATDFTSAQVAAEIANGNATKVLADADGNITVPYANVSAEYLYLAHVATDTTKTKWEDPDDPNNSGNIGNPSDLFGAVATENVDSPDALWSAVSFKIYKTNYATHFDNGVEFKNS